MSVELKEVKNLKIVPENYTSGTFCEIKNISDTEINMYLPKVTASELNDYQNGNLVEIFGLHKNGLIYFKSEILNKNDKNIDVKYPNDIKEIQRRKYTRVKFDGKLSVIRYDDVKIIPNDISAGGLRFISDKAFIVGNEYEIKIELLNNLVVNCTMQPIRVEETDNAEDFYSISVKFKKIRSIDRIALMQYSLRVASEMENKA